MLGRLQKVIDKITDQELKQELESIKADLLDIKQSIVVSQLIIERKIGNVNKHND